MRCVLSRLVLVLGLLTALLGGLTATATTANAADPAYRILNNATGGSLLPDGYGNNSADGIYMWAWNPAATLGGDQWTFEPSGGDHYLIRNTKTGKCLKPGGPYGYRTYVTQGTCNNSYEFQWGVDQRFDGQYKITSRSAQQVMAPYYGSGLNEVVTLEPDSNIAKVWWSINRI
jgi:hypothetical protein